MMNGMGRGLLAFGLMVCLLWAGCSLIEPADSELNANQPPETVLTASPPDVYDHIVEFQWKGEDSDGIIMSYEISVDGGPWIQTTSTDTIITFNVSDDALHVFAVRAYDDDGDVDDTPAEVAFTATSIAPQTTFEVVPENQGLIYHGAVVGPGLTLEMNAEDPDDIVFEWRYQIDATDDAGWSEWQADSVFAFADPEIIEGALGLLPVGEHTFYAQARDAAGLIDPTPAYFEFEVAEGAAPTLEVNFNRLNTQSFYRDFSGFTDPDLLNDVRFEARADASEYFGALGGFSYKWSEADLVEEAEFTDWDLEGDVIEIADVSPGQYWFILKARDTAGTETVENIFVDIVNPVTELDPDAVIVIHETRNGTGRPGSPSSEQVVEYYQGILGNRTYTEVLYSDLTAEEIRVSPGIAGRYGTVIWVDDDATEHFIFSQSHENNLRFFQEYSSLRSTYGLTNPTHMILSSWNIFAWDRYDDELMTAIFGVTPDGTNGQDRTYLLGQGQGPLAGVDIQVDPEKLPSSFNGMLNKVWTLVEPEGATTLTTWVSGEPGELDGHSSAYYYAQEDIEVVITGYPLFFMTNGDAFMNAAFSLFGF